MGGSNLLFCDGSARWETFGRIMSNGSPFIDMFCHWGDDWSCAFGSRVTAVCANGFRFTDALAERPPLGRPAIDTGAALLRFESGDIGCLAASWALPDMPDVYLLQNATPDAFVGPKGFVMGGVRNTMKLVTAAGIEEFHNDGSLDDTGHPRQVAAFCDAIRKGTPPIADAETGLYTLRVSLAILKSIEEGRTVRLDEI